MVRVSVVIPTYNRGQFLAKTIQSVLGQAEGVLEVLVCDDGSTDNSEEIVRKYAPELIRWLPGKHSGLPAVPRNRGLRLAKGDWIAMLDSDDLWLPGKIAVQLSSAEKFSWKAVCTNGYRLVNNKKQDRLLSWPKKTITFSDLLQNNQVIASSAIFHRSLLPKVIGFPEWPYLKSIEDYAFWLRIASVVPFGYINEPMVLYRSDPADTIRRSAFYTNFSQQLVAALSNYLPWYLRFKLGR